LNNHVNWFSEIHIYVKEWYFEALKSGFDIFFLYLLENLGNITKKAFSVSVHNQYVSVHILVDFPKCCHDTRKKNASF
jgi:hypothetical protein